MKIRMKSDVMRCDFIVVIEVKDSNLNGDPDCDNQPRTDPFNNEGLASDACFKRKMRNYIDTIYGEEDGYEIYHSGALINDQHNRAWEAIAPGTKDTEKVRSKSHSALQQSVVPKARQWMCDHFFDVRAFGAVMSTNVNCGDVWGPITVQTARSIDPVEINTTTITRASATNEKDRDKAQTFGHKHTVYYGLYTTCISINAFAADKSGFNKKDLDRVSETLVNMLELDRSAARPGVSMRHVFKCQHSHKMGSMPLHKLIERLKIEKIIDTDPRKFSDYNIEFDITGLDEITVTELVDGEEFFFKKS